MSARIHNVAGAQAALSMLSPSKRKSEQQTALERYKVIWQCNILDSKREEEFDRLCSVTARLLKVPFCFVAILDVKRVWVKTSVGFECPQEFEKEDTLVTEITRMSTGDIFQCPDLTADPAHAQLTCVATKPHMAFYCQCPIVVDGAIVGALCVADRVARSPLDVTSKMNLLDFSHAFANILEQRRSDLLFKSLDSQMFVNALATSLQSSVSQVQLSATKVTSEIRRNSNASESVSLSSYRSPSERASLRTECLHDINTSLTQIGMMTNMTPHNFLPANNESSKNSIKAIMAVIQDTLPMLVCEHRADWTLAGGLDDVFVHFPDVLLSVLIALLFPLCRVSTSLHTSVQFSCDSDPLLPTNRAPGLLVEDQRIQLGQVKIRIVSHETINDRSDFRRDFESNQEELSESERPIVQSLISLALGDVTDEGAIASVWSKTVTMLQRPPNSDEEKDTRKVDYLLTLPCQVVTTQQPLQQPSEPSPVNANASALSNPDAPVVDPDAPLNVLIVDDCKMIQKVLGRFLKSQGCVVTSAENGMVGFEKLRLCAEEPPHDVVFMDFLMPVMDGLETLKAFDSWREEHPELREKLKHMFIIGFSATAHSQEQDDAFDVGMHVFLPKPANTKIVSALLDMKKKGLPSETIAQNLSEEFKECRLRAPSSEEQ